MSITLTQILRDAERILVFTGAGISTGSGIPDYRGPKGVWNTRQPVYYDDFMSSADARARYWTQKQEDWEAFRDARPNAVHEACVRLEQSGKLHLLVTQNVDGLHAKAGNSRDRMVEIHGTNSLIECQSCGENTDPDPHYATYLKTQRVPDCHCGGYLKPATISFGQSLRGDDLRRAFEAAEQADCVVSLGSTLQVTPAADVPMTGAQRGAPYAIVNQGETAHDHSRHVALRLDGDVNQLFPAAVDEALATEEAP